MRIRDPPRPHRDVLIDVHFFYRRLCHVTWFTYCRRALGEVEPEWTLTHAHTRGPVLGAHLTRSARQRRKRGAKPLSRAPRESCMIYRLFLIVHGCCCCMKTHTHHFVRLLARRCVLHAKLTVITRWMFIFTPAALSAAFLPKRRSPGDECSLVYKTYNGVFGLICSPERILSKKS